MTNEMLSGLGKGAKVIDIDGHVGVVTAVDKETVTYRCGREQFRYTHEHVFPFNWRWYNSTPMMRMWPVYHGLRDTVRNLLGLGY